MKFKEMYIFHLWFVMLLIVLQLLFHSCMFNEKTYPSTQNTSPSHTDISSLVSTSSSQVTSDPCMPDEICYAVSAYHLIFVNFQDESGASLAVENAFIDYIRVSEDCPKKQRLDLTLTGGLPTLTVYLGATCQEYIDRYKNTSDNLYFVDIVESTYYMGFYGYGKLQANLNDKTYSKDNIYIKEHADYACHYFSTSDTICELITIQVY